MYSVIKYWTESLRLYEDWVKCTLKHSSSELRRGEGYKEELVFPGHSLLYFIVMDKVKYGYNEVIILAFSNSL